MLRFSIFLSCFLTLAFPQHSTMGEWQSADGISGTLILAGGGTIPDDVKQLFREVVGERKVYIISEAADDADAAADRTADWLRQIGVPNVTTRCEFAESSRLRGSTDLNDETVRAIDSAEGVWICGGQQSQLVRSFPGSGIRSALQRLLNRGGIIAGTSAGAAIMSGVMIVSGKSRPAIDTGWDLLPGAIVDQHFSQRDRIGRTRLAVSGHPECFGIGIDEGTAVIVRGRRMRVTGAGAVTLVLAETEYRGEEIRTLTNGEQADLIQLRRAARQRAASEDPGHIQSGKTDVSAGALVIVGGGRMPGNVSDRFVELAGGRAARIVVLPTAVPADQTDRRIPDFLRSREVADVVVLPHRGHAVSSMEFREAIESATGIWFGGGRQWNFVDSYEGTAAVDAFHDLLRRGGVIGGSSAGATIQGEFLVRGHPLGNTIMMAEGYERGFAFLPGSAIDQHFSQRSRQPDLLTVVHRHRKLLGIGIDEGTALVVRGDLAEVIGDHQVHFVRRDMLIGVPAEALPSTVDDARRFYDSRSSGESFRLADIVMDETADTP